MINTVYDIFQVLLFLGSYVLHLSLTIMQMPCIMSTTIDNNIRTYNKKRVVITHAHSKGSDKPAHACSPIKDLAAS